MKPIMLHEVAAKPLPAIPAIILRELIDNGMVERERLIDQIWGMDPDGGPEDVGTAFRVHLTYLRKALRPGWRIVREGNRALWLANTRRLGEEAALQPPCETETGPVSTGPVPFLQGR